MSGPKPKCSVLIANYNGEHLLADCIDSVLAQDADASIEIIVHDDASTDGSLELLASRYPQARVIASAENVGFCIANNRMADVAGGDYLLLLNNDAALFPDAISTLLAASTASEAILSLPQYAWDSGQLVNRGCRLDATYFAVPVESAADDRLAMVEGACLWLPGELWRKLGGFPAWFGSIAEDAFLCCAARIAGAGVRCTPASGYRHRQGSSFGGNRLNDGRLDTRYRRRRLSERNRIALLASCTPTPLVLPWLSLHVLLLLPEAAALCLWRRDLRPWREIYLPALRDAWRNRQAILSLRREAQARRRIGLRDYLRGFTCIPQKLLLLLRHGQPRLRE